ncbi:hypothetical protein YC2023_048904 [Brassica napus]
MDEHMEELREMLKNITLIDNPQQLEQNEIIIDHSSSSEEEPTFPFVNLLGRGREVQSKSKASVSTNKTSTITHFSEFPLPIESTRGEFTLPIISSEAINDKISKMKSSHQEKISYIHIGTIQIIVRSTFKKNIDSPIRLVVTDNRIQDENDRIIRIVDSNLKHSVVKFNVVCQYGIPLATKNLNNSIGIIYNFQRHDLMEDGDHPLSITYAVGYALSSSAHSIEFANKNDIYLENLFKETTTVKIFVLDVKLSSYNTDYKNRENRSTNRGRSCS